METREIFSALKKSAVCTTVNALALAAVGAGVVHKAIGDSATLTDYALGAVSGFASGLLTGLTISYCNFFRPHLRSQLDYANDLLGFGHVPNLPSPIN